MQVNNILNNSLQTIQAGRSNSVSQSEQILEESEENQSLPASSSTLPRYDQIEISEEGLAASEQIQKMKNQGMDDSSKISAQASSSSIVSSGQPQDTQDTMAIIGTDSDTESEATALGTGAESDSDVDTNKLYLYTDSELDDLLRDGSITQAQYDKEMAKRGNIE